MLWMKGRVLSSVTAVLILTPAIGRAQTTPWPPTERVLHHGEWRMVATNSMEDILLQFVHGDEPREFSATLTRTSLSGGPTQVNYFVGNPLPMHAGANLASQFDMSGGDAVCGTLEPIEGFPCFIVRYSVDGYVPGDHGSKLFTLVLEVKLVGVDGVLLHGQFYNRLPLKIDANGNVIWPST